MADPLTALVHRFAGLRALVLGDAMLDVYTNGEARRLCPEAPVPVIDVRSRAEFPGGAANTAVNVAGLGAQTTFLSVIGDDEESRRLTERLGEQAVVVEELIIDRNRRTLTKHRVMAEDQLLVRYDDGTVQSISGATERRLLDALRRLYPQVDVLLVSDYRYGVMTDAVLEGLIDLQAGAPKPILVDAKDLARYWSLRPTAVKPNFRQAIELLDNPVMRGNGRPQSLMAFGPQLRDVTGAELVAVTMDRDGAMLFSGDGLPYRTYAQAAPHAETAGAGDTYLAALGLALAADADPQTAAEIAGAAAGIVVAKPYTACCTANELLQRFGEERSETDPLRALLPVLETYRRTGRRIVLTNGCFDILHRGHISYLQQAKTLGDVLIVGVNCDDSIRRLKGPDRPINSLEDRLRVLGALGCIDHLVPFAEATPIALVEAIRPDVFVKGGDYTRETLPEAEAVERHGGSVKILPFVADRSTTRIISRIRAVESSTPEMALSAAGSD